MKTVKVASWVYRKYCASTGLNKELWNRLKSLLIRLLNDPACLMYIHKRYMKLPLSHSLPAYLSQFPQYDRLPGRLGVFFHKRQNHLVCIDVGANIGDSIAGFYQSNDDMFLAIEPDPKFLKFLADNWSWNNNVKPAAFICSALNGSEKCLFAETHGTAKLCKSETAPARAMRTLDSIIADFPDLARPDIIKIDTDGYDFKVIAGAHDTIRRHNPAVLFESGVFANENYLEDCLATLCFFRDNGYGQMLLYDNLGYLLGIYRLDDMQPVKKLLFYQLSKPLYYYDILLMKNPLISQFYDDERDYFAQLNVKSPSPDSISAV